MRKYMCMFEYINTIYTYNGDYHCVRLLDQNALSRTRTYVYELSVTFKHSV